MSVVAYTGLPGSGKSYGVVENVIIPALKAGRHVVTNMPLNLDRLRAEYPAGRITKLPEGCDAKTIVDMAVAGCVLVLDETWRYWPAGMKDHTIPESQKELFAMHRHKVADGFSMEIVVVTQDLAQVAMFVRSLVEQTFRSVKLTAIGSKTKFRIDVYEGPVTGPKPPQAKKIRSMYGKYQASIYQFYKSHTQSDGGAGSEEKADDRGSILKGAKFKVTVIALVLLPLLIYVFCRAFVHVFHKGESVPQDASPVNVPANSRTQTDEKSSGPVESKVWRLVGKVIIGETVYFLVDSQGGPRRVPLADCDRDQDQMNWRCRVDGEVATAWTGPPPPVLQQFVGDGATPQAMASAR